jgi:hypothetical protein
VRRRPIRPVADRSNAGIEVGSPDFELESPILADQRKETNCLQATSAVEPVEDVDLIRRIRQISACRRIPSLGL